MDNSDQSLLAEALRDALSLAKRISKNQFCATSLAVCVKVDGQTITKAPDWFYVPYVHPLETNRRSYTPNVEGQLPTIVMEFLGSLVICVARNELIKKHIFFILKCPKKAKGTDAQY